MSLYATGHQTVGPYLAIGLSWLTTTRIAPAGTPGERVTIEGRVLDGDGQAVTDGLIEIWQADANGKYAHPEDPQKKAATPGFRGFGRMPTNGRGGFRFSTVKPGSVPGPNGVPQAPHLVVSVFMRGSLKHLASRIYFPDDPANAKDPILKLVPPARRGTLIAKRPRGRRGALQWDVILQGPDETVFFDY
jgi:protocatechuate 3,4-dioxygenase alpha subunit